MKIDKESTMNTSKRDKSTDKSKQDKAAQKEKEKKDKKKTATEKESSKSSKDKDKSMKKSSSNLNQSNVSMPVISAPLTSSATTSDINKFGKQQSQNDQLLLNESTASKQQTPPLTSSKSENVLSIFKKQTSQAKEKKSADAKKNKSQTQLDPSQTVTKGRFRCQVVYLDESVKTFDLDKNAIGDDLMTQVCTDLDLEEREYFSLTYRDVNNMKLWLDHDKKIKYQLKGNINTQEPVFSFEVKFYPPEPHVLQEEITKYLLTLQLRHDIMDGKLPCTFITLALLGSYTAQAELGDYDDAINNAIVSDSQQNINGLSGFEYLEQFCFAPNQMPELLAAIAEFHKDHKGQTPAEAEQHYLENAVKLAMYGVDLHNAKDSDGVDILIGVSASGLLVFRDHLRINRFAWPKILKISYKRNHFYLKLRPGEFEKYETTIGFRCPNHKAAKRLWKLAVEHHAFFRLREPEKSHKSRSLLPIPSFNQKFRYTGSSTYMQSRHRSIERSQPQFPRSFSKSMARSVDHGLSGDVSTPGSVQSAAANHYNKMKPHASVANIPNRQQQPYDEREEEEAGDYTVDDGAYIPQVRPPQQQAPQQLQQQYSNRSNNNNNNDSYTGQRGANSSGGSSNTPSNSNSYQYRKPNTTYPPNLQLGQIQQQQYGDDGGEDQVEDYYTSVDRNYEDNASNNRTPSSIKRAIINASNLNQVLPTSPINSQPASQRYVPPPQSSQRYQPDPLQQQQYSPNRQYQQQQFQLPVSPRGQQQPYNLNKSFDNLSLNQAESDSVFTSSTPNYAGTPPPLVIPPATPLASSSLNSFKASIIQQSKKADGTSGADSSITTTSTISAGPPRYVPPTSSSLSGSNRLKPDIKPKPQLPLASPPPLPQTQPPQALAKPMLVSAKPADTSVGSASQINLSPVDARLVKEGIPVLIASSESQTRTITRSAGVSVSSSTGKSSATNSREDLTEKLSFVEKLKKFEKSYVVNKDQYNQSPNGSYYQNQQQPQATTSVSSMRSVNFADQQQQVPQPQARGTLSQSGTSSTITSSRMPVPQQRNQNILVDQTQTYRTASNYQPTSQSSSIRQQQSSILNTSSGSGYVNAGGTTEVTRTRKQIVFNNEDMNQKDLILRALEVATELDPNLEVEKVEISTDE